MVSYATVDDYELRTGVDVPVEMEPTVQIRLDDTSAIIQLYLGECAVVVEGAYPDLLTALTCSHVYRLASIPTGVRSESVGSTSVSYDDNPAGVGLSPDEIELLDSLIESACGADAFRGVGEVGVGWAGPSPDVDWGDIDAWVLAGPPR